MTSPLRISIITFQWVIVNFISIFCQWGYEYFAANKEKLMSTKILISKNIKAQNFFSTRSATKKIFYNSSHPVINTSKTKKHAFTRKHELYGHKTNFSVLPNEVVIDTSSSFFGSVLEISIFLSQLQWHQLAYKRLHDTEKCAQSASNTEGSFTNEYSTLLNRWYCYISPGVHSMISKKKLRCRILTAS